MEKKVTILAVCSHTEILETIVRLLNNNPQWQGIGAASTQQALTLFREQAFDVVLLGSGMDAVTENELKPVFLTMNPNVKFVQHYGGGSGLLTCEIYEALAASG